MATAPPRRSALATSLYTPESKKDPIWADSDPPMSECKHRGVEFNLTTFYLHPHLLTIGGDLDPAAAVRPQQVGIISNLKYGCTDVT